MKKIYEYIYYKLFRFYSYRLKWTTEPQHSTCVALSIISSLYLLAILMLIARWLKVDMFNTGSILILLFSVFALLRWNTRYFNYHHEQIVEKFNSETSLQKTMGSIIVGFISLVPYAVIIIVGFIMK